jgi:hypothetical protein
MDASGESDSGAATDAAADAGAGAATTGSEGDAATE